MSILDPSNIRKAANFVTGNVTLDRADVEVVKRVVNHGLGDFESSLLDDVRTRAPRLIRETDGLEYVLPVGLPQRLVSVAKSFTSIPMDLINWVAKKFPDSALDNAGFIRRYRESVELDNNVNSYRGMYNQTIKYIKSYMKANGINPGDYPTDTSSELFNAIKDDVTSKFNETTNKIMADGVANYDTKKERFATRLVSGFTAATFLGSDFFNKATKKGKTVEEAKKEQNKKQWQEVLENLSEGAIQLGVFSLFTELVNKSPVVPAVLSMMIGIGSRIISRKSMGMPLTRIKSQDPFKSYMPSMNEYIQSVKDKNTSQVFDRKREEKAKALYDDGKKPFLTWRKIVGFCVASIAIGSAIKGGKDILRYTEFGRRISNRFTSSKFGQTVTDFARNHSQRARQRIIEEVNASTDELKNLSALLRNAGDESFASAVDKAIAAEEGGIVRLGTDYKTMKLFGMDVRTKDVLGIPTAIFRFGKEVVSYPYKMFSKLVYAMVDAGRKKKNLPPIPKNNPIQDTHHIKNLYKRYAEYRQKYPNDVELTEQFGNYVKRMRRLAKNSAGSSKGDNSQIAVMAQVLGTLSGMWFNMNDEYNSSINLGKTKKEAEKDARLRGINKFLRMSTQVIISGGLNSMFSKQYNASIASSAVIVALSTFLTDWCSRLLSGMPGRKMNQEELKEYDKRLKEGPMKHYYNLIDKAAS